MLRNYTVNPIDSYKKSIALVGCCIHNKSQTNQTAFATLKDSNGFIKAEILCVTLTPKETMFLDSKIFLSDGDLLEFGGCDIVFSGSEDAL